jgi:hypothetical protein
MAFPKIDDVLESVVNNINEAEPLAQAPEPIAEQQTVEATPTPTEEVTPEEQKILDLKELVKDSKFKFEDKEYTLDDLKKHMMRDADYRKKTQELSAFKKQNEQALKEHEELKGDQKYWENLQYDLAALRADPSQLWKFKQVYPEKFHAYAKEFEQHSNVDLDSIRKEFKSLIDKEINPIRESLTEREKQAELARWNAWDTEAKSKFPYALPQQVEGIIRQAEAEKMPITQDTWNQAYKISHEAMEARAKEIAQAQFLKTKQNNTAAKEPKGGGSIPIQSQEKIPWNKTQEALMRYLGAS